jgi:hypothetical protein
MTPRDVEQLTAAEFEAFRQYQNRTIRAANRAAKKKR